MSYGRSTVITLRSECLRYVDRARWSRAKVKKWYFSERKEEVKCTRACHTDMQHLLIRRCKDRDLKVLHILR